MFTICGKKQKYNKHIEVSTYEILLIRYRTQEKDRRFKLKEEIQLEKRTKIKGDEKR